MSCHCRWGSVCSPGSMEVLTLGVLGVETLDELAVSVRFCM